MPMMERGHEHAGRGTVITLNEPTLAGLDDRQVAGFVDALLAISGAGPDVDESAAVADLAERLGLLGIEQPEPVLQRMVENLRSGSDLTIVTDDGRVLHGDPSWTPATHDPDVDATEDPQHPDRPAYS